MSIVENLIINKRFTIRNALKKIDEQGKQILLVTDDDKKFLGTITDGDIRRWILKNGDMNDSVSNIMNTNSIVLKEKDIELAHKVMAEKSINAVPILSDDNNVVDIKFINKGIIQRNNNLNNIPLVIMAGGLGTRLYPYTKILPKPLIPIGDTPIVERIINKFNNYGVNKFYLTVNYKKSMIKSYFNELSKDYEVEYVEEDKPLGTGGSLSLLKGTIKSTFFVSNCDILINAEYDDILKFHKENGNKVTIVASMKNFTVPYGVFKLNEKGSIEEVQEKPEYSYLVNTGMYILEPEVLDDIPKGVFYDLPTIVENYIKDNIKVGVYPISEHSWMDMGQISEMKEMIERIEEEELSE